MPKRIQRKRTKGWRMPDDAVLVSRPTKWGNPYRVGMPDPMIEGAILDASAAVRMFEWYLENYPALVAIAKVELRGWDLACYCALDQPCHADALLRLANE